VIPGSYEQILEMISKGSGVSIEELERKIEAKRAKLSGLISKEGAAQIIASELGINFEKQKMKISELLTGMKKINIIGKIIRMNRVVEYNKNGREGKIGSFQIADESSNIRVVLWDTNHIALIEKGEIAEGGSVEIAGADVRNGEVHLSGFSDIKKSDQVFESVQEKAVVHAKNISDVRTNENVSVRAFVVQVYGPSFFYVCPECNKKVAEVNKCAEHGNVVAVKRAIINFILDDGTGVIRSTLFDEQAHKVASDADLETNESFMTKRDELIGKEFVIDGNIRKNRLYETDEMIVSDLKEVEVDALIAELEAKAK
jgi:replication factor A1